ncbi:hypothetical protein [Aquibacillus salsiterrae]|uniref:Uncharacterized protein n=1 Tax=Aquibacillus salsiterrae TaxID=2950439 RepID=A0A9X3WH48_9BACI|nr:hypothetical protein [Aquibacillus salsiterrae]MDC3416926.1 hypothetical protein [Aquibacillus salsiterrae]
MPLIKYRFISIILGIVSLLFISFFLQAQMNIPIYIAIPLVATAFFVASKRTTNRPGGDASGFSHTNGQSDEVDSE